MSQSPDEDRGLSPYTGWTRAHWERLADNLVLSARRFGSDSHAQIRMPGPASVSGEWSDGLEGFARTFLMAGLRLRGAGGEDPHGIAEWYADGLAAGADPDHPERWPTFDEIGQAKVEAASVAIALHETRPWIWDRLSDRTRTQLVEWLDDLVGATTPDNNWIWFQSVAQTFLRSVGGPFDQAELDRNCERTDAWYRGGGWYSDGGCTNFDYYSGWAMHFYPLWWCRIGGDSPDTTSRVDTYRERLREYLDQYQHLIAPDGSPLFQGRSLTYRFAMLAPLWAGIVFDASPLSPGRTRRLASGVLRHFVERGAVDDDGLLSIGWGRAFSSIRQGYSGPGSPYWASKGLAGLVLPPDHPVWTDVEEPAEIDEHDVSGRFVAPGWLLSGTRSDGIVRIVNHGADHARPTNKPADDPFYAKIGFSTHAAPDTDQDARASPYDSTATLIGQDGAPAHRGSFELLSLSDTVAVSRSQVGWVDGADFRPAAGVTIASVLRGAVEVRLAVVDQVSAANRLRIAGFALADDTAPNGQYTVDGQGQVAAWATTVDGRTSTVVGLLGFDAADLIRRSGTNAFGAHTVIPFVETRDPLRPGEVYAAAVILAGEAAAPAGPEAAASIRVEPTPGGVAVHWPDGSTDDVVLTLDP